VNRTDRTLRYFEGDNNGNVRNLYDILMTYCMYNFDLGYVQVSVRARLCGKSLSPFLGHERLSVSNSVRCRQ
jgi:hypothetical protein